MGDYDPTRSEIQDPPLRLTIQGRRWMGEEWETVREPVEIDLFGTDCHDDPRVVLLALRRIALQRFDAILSIAALKRSQLDFDSPNLPTEDDIEQLVNDGKEIYDAARVLRELMPEVIEPEGSEETVDAT